MATPIRASSRSETPPTPPKKTTYGPRERAIEDGPESLGDAELVALVLGTGHAKLPVVSLATALVEASGGLAGLGRTGAGALAARPGLGHAKAARLAASFELGRRVAREVARVPGERLPSGKAVDAWARPRLAALDHEELWVLALDGHNGLRAARRVAAGGLHGLTIAARDPLRVALREGASAFVLVHNHPSGDPTPSAEDVAFTDVMASAGHAVGTPMLDHVVVARRGFVSMLEGGYFEAPRPRRAPRRARDGAGDADQGGVTAGFGPTREGMRSTSSNAGRA